MTPQVEPSLRRGGGGAGGAGGRTNGGGGGLGGAGGFGGGGGGRAAAAGSGGLFAAAGTATADGGGAGHGGATGNQVALFFAGPESDRGGVQVAVRDLNGDGTSELVTRAAESNRVFDPQTWEDVTADFDPVLIDAVFVD